MKTVRKLAKQFARRHPGFFVGTFCPEWVPCKAYVVHITCAETSAHTEVLFRTARAFKEWLENVTLEQLRIGNC